MEEQKVKRYRLGVSRTFPSTHQRKGEETGFVNAILKSLNCPDCTPPDVEDYCNGYRTKIKRHTIRNNYELWAKRMAEVQAGRAVIEIYYWDGKPRHKGSKQVVFAVLDKDSGCGVQRVYFAINTLKFAFIDNFEEKQSLTDAEGIHILNKLAKNDGLSLDDFMAWFKNYDLSTPKAIIQFTNFRY